jgi:hypothetical protein
MFPVRFGQTERVELSFKQNTGGWILSWSLIVTLIQHCYISIDLIYVPSQQSENLSLKLWATSRIVEM